ncbi:MAG: VWA domain-containing protein [Spirochaetaceae bacterium]|nr:VWA domain-containing protein [Spirochaetaceae bacterium]
MFNPKEFTVTNPKPLPIILLLDTSGSMYGENINSLNKAVKEMVQGFKNIGNHDNEIYLSIISFNSTIKCFPEERILANISDFSIVDDLVADGMTSMGAAISVAKEMVENKDVIPYRAYRPTIVLVSDGGHNDNWQGPMNDFINNGRSRKCDRMAMAIGRSADKNALSQFITGTENKLFEAKDASSIIEFFKKVTMSVTVRSRSANPNLLPSTDELMVR